MVREVERNWEYGVDKPWSDIWHSKISFKKEKRLYCMLNMPYVQSCFHRSWSLKYTLHLKYHLTIRASSRRSQFWEWYTGAEKKTDLWNWVIHYFYDNEDSSLVTRWDNHCISYFSVTYDQGYLCKEEFIGLWFQGDKSPLWWVDMAAGS